MFLRLGRRRGCRGSTRSSGAFGSSRTRGRSRARMRAARPYGEKIRNVAAHLSHAHPEYKHSFLIQREGVKRVGVIMVTSDKGLCGGLNTNVTRMVLNQMKKWESSGVGVDACANTTRRAKRVRDSRRFPRGSGGDGSDRNDSGR